jgi:two-component system, response regulator PdtaR
LERFVLESREGCGFYPSQILGKAVIPLRTVLICDDEPVIRLSLKNKLRDLGFDEIMECGDGECAVTTALSRMPDIAILDIAMPKKNGLAAAREIRKKLKIPIIFLTAAYDAEAVRLAKEAGVAAFLTKPLRDQDLWPAIELAFAHADELETLKEQVEDLKETIESRKVIDKAKGVLMRTQGLSEPEAFRKMQKLAMDKRKSMRQIAEAIMLTES